MSDLIWLSEAQMRRIEPYFPLSHGVPRVDDRRVLSGIVFVIRNGLRWRDVPTDYGPHKTIYNRFIRWSRLGVFNRIFAGLAAEGGHRRPAGDGPRFQWSDGARDTTGRDVATGTGRSTGAVARTGHGRCGTARADHGLWRWGQGRRTVGCATRVTRTVRPDVGDVVATNWLATITFDFTTAPMSEGDRFRNPLGFQVATYRIDPEVVQ